MTFTYEFPLFLIVERFSTVPGRPDDITFHNMVTLGSGSGAQAVAVFTDRDAAEQFRDDHAPRHQVFEMPDAVVLVTALTWAKRLADTVVFDPLRPGLRAASARIDDIIGFYYRPG